MKVIFGPELYYVGAPKILDGGFRIIGRLPYPYYRLFLIALAIVMVLATLLSDLPDQLRPEGARGPPQPGDVRLPRHRHGAGSTC